jgi:putative transposase
LVDFVRELSSCTQITQDRIVSWVGISRGKFFDWIKRFGKANEHNALIPRDHWLDPAERLAIIEFFDRHPLEGYRRLTFMMLDADVVAVSPATVYRVLAGAGRLSKWNRTPSKKGTGFVQEVPSKCVERNQAAA